MADYSVEIAALRDAIATGARRIRIKSGDHERDVEFPSFAELLARLNYLEGLQAAAARPAAGFAKFDRGDR